MIASTTQEPASDGPRTADGSVPLMLGGLPFARPSGFRFPATQRWLGSISRVGPGVPALPHMVYTQMKGSPLGQLRASVNVAGRCLALLRSLDIVRQVAASRHLERGQTHHRRSSVKTKRCTCITTPTRVIGYTP